MPAMMAYEYFDWIQRLPGDVSIDAFEGQHSIFDFDWDLAVWWNKDLATATRVLDQEKRLGRLYDPLGDLRGALEAPNGLEMFEHIVARAPRTEARCMDHIELAVRHIIKSNQDVQGKPFLVYDDGTGTWKQEGAILTNDWNRTVGSLVDRVAVQFGMALGRAADALYTFRDVVEPPTVLEEDPAWTQDELDEWKESMARREEMTEKIVEVHKMARSIPRGKYTTLATKLRPRVAESQVTWDAQTEWLILRDGVVNVEDVLKSGEVKLLPFSPKHMSTMALEVGWGDATRNAGKSEWDRGVEKVLPNEAVRKYLQKRFGTALLGRPGIAGKSMVWQFGVGDTAKSTLQECIAGAKGVFAPYSLVSSSDSITEKGVARGAGDRFKAYARGKRFALMSEMDDGERLDQTTVKSITGGETVEGTAKYANAVEYFFTATLFIASNHPPTFPPGDTALVGRIHVVPFEHRLWVRSKNPKEWEAAPPEHRADEDWKDGVLSSPQERAAIFRWVIDGLIAFGREGGLAELPKEITEAGEEFAQDADPVGRLVRTLIGTDKDYDGPPWLRLYTDGEWHAEGLKESDGVLLQRIEVLIEARAKELGMAGAYGLEGLSPKWMRAAKRMLHEIGGARKVAMVDAESRKTGTVYSRLREISIVDTTPAVGAAVGGEGVVLDRPHTIDDDI